jgi:hypothetical protein
MVEERLKNMILDGIGIGSTGRKELFFDIILKFKGI